jgi:hypothetical protein
MLAGAPVEAVLCAGDAMFCEAEFADDRKPIASVHVASAGHLRP